MTSALPDDWRPTCSVPMLRLRAKALAAFRSFFASHSYLEVETPLLSHDIVVDAYLDPFPVHEPGLFLQTSPEAGMKRLLAAGSGSIYQITRSFRRAESGQRHNPEFTMAEWYGVGSTDREQMQLTMDLVRSCVAALQTDSEVESLFDEPDWWHQPFGVVTYQDAFRRVLDGDVLDMSVSQLESVAAGNDVAIPDGLSKDDILNQLLTELIEPTLGHDRPEFLCDYPISQAALAEANSDDDRTARRFELYARNLELCNGYQELTDADELRRRDQDQNSVRASHGSDALTGAFRMMAAMTHGLPACSGVALGFDRLVMAITGRTSIADVLPFPIDRA